MTPREAFIDRLPLDMTPSSRERGEWFVARRTTDRWGEETCEYLHQDGAWRSSTFSNGWPGQPTGYFQSHDEAKAALTAALAA